MNKTVKIWLLVLFILTLASVHIGLTLVAIGVSRSPIPEFHFGMIWHMWKFYLVLPIPLASVILGVIYIKQGYKCLKNIIAGIIFGFLLFIFGAFTFLFANQFSRDMSYLHDVSNIVHFDLPDGGEICVAYDYIEEGSSMAMVKVTEQEASSFVTTLAKNANWKRDISFIPANAIDLFTVSETRDFDYFSVYNLTANRYNTFSGQLIFMAYDVETRVIYIYFQGNDALTP